MLPAALVCTHSHTAGGCSYGTELYIYFRASILSLIVQHYACSIEIAVRIVLTKQSSIIAQCQVQFHAL